MLILNQLKITNYKNYIAETLDFAPKLNALVGMNGMGKTNLIDAVHYLCMGRSYFTTSDRDVVRQEEGIDFFRLEGYFSKHGKLETVVAKVMPGKKKELECNKIAYVKLSEHIGHFPIVVVAPSDVQLALGGSEDRRQFLDSTLSQLNFNYLQALIQYNKLLQQRNALLKQFAEQKSFDRLLINTYDAQIVPIGNFIHEVRKEFSLSFLPIFLEKYAQISKAQESVKLVYESDLHHAPFEQLLAMNLEKDRLLQRTTTGIHKDEINFLIKNFTLKKYASQGQLKSFILALKLSQYQILRQEKQISPILLLDDLFDRLDKYRVEQLIELLLGNEFGQIFITDTDVVRMAELIKKVKQDYSIYKIEFGQALKQASG